jgi:ribosomal protein S18 acetylase RimI-like enzyme
MKIERVDKFRNIEKLSKLIYINFLYLQNEPGLKYTLDDIQETLKASNNISFFLTDSENKIVGYLIGIPKEISDGRFVYYISYFYIIEKYRGYGLGEKMLEYTINYIKKLNIKFIMLITKKESVAYNLYTKYGFIKDPIIEIQNNNYILMIRYND